MKREILFKAVKADGSGWIEGNLTHNTESGKSWIGNFAFGNYWHLEVIPETVCQFTGRTDITGKKIFECDECQYSENQLKKCFIRWNKRSYSFVANVSTYGKSFSRLGGMSYLKIIGNIHDKHVKP